MPDREKVIRGLECCAAMSGDHCRKCPYGDECHNANLPYGMSHLAGDAFAMLKEQEPRVMDDALLLEYDNAVWIENKRDPGTVISICKSADDRQFRFFSKNEWESVAYLRKNYGKTWRCWTSRPSEQKMWDTPWEGENDGHMDI